LRVIKTDGVPAGLEGGGALPGKWGSNEVDWSLTGDHEGTWTTTVNTVDGEDHWLGSVNWERSHQRSFPTGITIISQLLDTIVVKGESVVSVNNDILLLSDHVSWNLNTAVSDVLFNMVVGPDPLGSTSLAGDSSPWSWVSSVGSVGMGTWPARIIKTDVIPSSFLVLVASPVQTISVDSKSTREGSNDTTWTTQISSLNSEDNWLVGVNLEGCSVGCLPSGVTIVGEDLLSIVPNGEGVVDVDNGVNVLHVG